MSNTQSPSVESYRIAPDAFTAPGERYLGNAAVVAELVGGFCAHAEAVAMDLRAGKITPAAAQADMAEKIRSMARVFSGGDPDFQIIKGYHDVSLGGKLIADMGDFWRDHRQAWGDDPVAVLFDWLGALVMEKAGQTDEDWLLEIMLRPSVQYASSVLLGIEKRAAPVS